VKRLAAYQYCASRTGYMPELTLSSMADYLLCLAAAGADPADAPREGRVLG
jgi:hypothetical protein